MLDRLLDLALRRRLGRGRGRPRPGRGRRVGVPPAQARSLPRHLRPRRRGHHAPAGLRRRGSRAAGHGPDRARPQQHAVRHRPALADDLRALRGGADLRRQDRRLLRPPAGAGAPARRRAARGRHPHPRSALERHQRVLSLHPGGPRPGRHASPGDPGLGDRPAPHPGPGRGRRGDVRRPGAPVPHRDRSPSPRQVQARHPPDRRGGAQQQPERGRRRARASGSSRWPSAAPA